MFLNKRLLSQTSIPINMANIPQTLGMEWRRPKYGTVCRLLESGQANIYILWKLRFSYKFFVKITLWQRVFGNLVFVILTSFSIQNLPKSRSMVLPKLNYCSIPSISAFISKIYYHQPNPTFSQNIVNYDGIWHFYINKFKNW